MANNVFANGREISCKSGEGKSICAFPDVCMTPPENPATPPGVPVPYPNTGMASDMTSGSKEVQISGKEVMLKNKSYFKKSTGDEAGSAAKKGVISSVNRGKVYFIAWSMDVTVEGENVVRHLDMTTHNHASPIGDTPPTIHVDSVAISYPASCEAHVKSHNRNCKGAKQTHRFARDRSGNIKVPRKKKPAGLDCSKAKNPSACKKVKACLLVPKKLDKKYCCKPDTTGHHMIENHWVKGKSGNFPTAQGSRGYNAAPTVCASQGRTKGTHGILHGVQGVYEESYLPGNASKNRPTGARRQSGQANGGWNYGAGKEASMAAHKKAFASSRCNPKCIEDQLDKFYGNDPNRTLNQPKGQTITEDDRPSYEDNFGADT